MDDAAVKSCFDDYPDHVRTRLLELRSFIFSTAENHHLGAVVESLKWGEPSFSVKTGSPIRIDWKQKTPDSYYLFFHCQTKLVDTFRELYAQQLTFQGNRAIQLSLIEPLPQAIIQHCIMLAMTYQQRKHLPLLGA